MGDALRQWLDESGLADSERVHRLHREWVSLVGEPLARQTTEMAYDKGILTLRIAGASWRNELMMNREALRQHLNNQLGKELVTEIRVR